MANPLQLNYYPFGMNITALSSTAPMGMPNRYNTFQGQERIDDFDLGWYSYKYRNHDPTIGRFFNVDPLAESFYHNSTYAFSENKVTNHIELEGLEAYPALDNFKRQLQGIGDGISQKVNQARGWMDRNILRPLGDNEVSLQAEGKVTVGAQVSAEFKKGLGVTANLGSATVISGKISVTLSSDGLDFDLNVDPVGGEGGVEFQSELSASAIVGGGVKYSGQLDKVEKGNLIENEQIEVSGGVLGVASASKTYNIDDNSSTNKGALGLGGNFAFILGIEGRAELSAQKTKKNDEN